MTLTDTTPATPVQNVPTIVAVFSKPSCVQCVATYRALDEQGILYASIDVSKDLAALDYVMSLGYQSAPVVVAGDDHWSGFQPDKIAALKEKLVEESRLF